ncbi:MAG TPA: ABC transporter permease [Phenylobacterium sp.]|nr:ABC transporter permease [Phenylobacterium sp.]
MQTAEHMLRTGRRGTRHEFSLAFADLRASVAKLGLAWSLAWHDVVSRYRGSILGPLWITLSMALMVLGIGFLYSELQHISLTETLPFVALGIVFWGTISLVIIEGCDTFVLASSMLSQTSLPILTFIWRTVLRNLVVLSHHVVIIVAVLAVYGYWRTMNLPLAVAGLLLTLVNVAWMALAAAIMSARFRDIPQIVTSTMQFAMFMTPVFWRPDSRSATMHAVLTFNPFFHMLDSIRGPLLGVAPDPLSYGVLAVMAVLGWAATFTAFALTRRRIVHYL